MTSRLRRLIAGYPELLAVIAAAAIGLCVQPPLAALADHQGINVLLAVLVFATALTISPAAITRIAGAWRSLAAALAAGITVLPALSWAVSLMAAAGPLRDGIMTIGLAPCEIASVATTAMAGGEAALAAGVLIGSTVTTVLLAGPILTLESGHAGVSPGGIIANLALVVALPLAAGIAVRAKAPSAARAGRPANVTAMIAVAALVALIAAEVHLSASYLPVALALVVFLAASAALGHLLGSGLPGPGPRRHGPRGGRLPESGAGRPARAAVLLTTSMRDFAIAAGVAATAFGPAAAAPLGLYGILVLLWGTATAGALRQKREERPPSPRPRPRDADPAPHLCRSTNE